MSEPRSAADRPGSVTVVAVLFVLGALLQFGTAFLYVMLILRPGEEQQFYGGSVSDWYWALTAVMSVILALIYLWIARRQLLGDPQAWLLVNVLAVINIFFALFSLGYGTGWAALLVNVLALVLNNLSTSRAYFGVSGPGEGSGPTRLA